MKLHKDGLIQQTLDYYRTGVKYKYPILERILFRTCAYIELFVIILDLLWNGEKEDYEIKFID